MPHATHTINGVEIGERRGVTNPAPLHAALLDQRYNGDRWNLDTGLSWSRTPQGAVRPHPTLQSYGSATFWDCEHRNYSAGNPLTDDARTIIKAWLGELPEWPEGVDEGEARKALNPATSRIDRVRAILNIGSWGDIPEPENGGNGCLWEAEHSRLGRTTGPDTLCIPLTNLIRSWYGLDPVGEEVAAPEVIPPMPRGMSADQPQVVATGSPVNPDTIPPMPLGMTATLAQRTLAATTTGVLYNLLNSHVIGWGSASFANWPEADRAALAEERFALGNARRSAAVGDRALRHRALFELWASLAPPISPVVEPPWAAGEEAKYIEYRGYMEDYAANGGSPGEANAWFMADPLEEEAYELGDASDDAERARQASPNWPHMFATRRNLVRRWLGTLATLPVPDLIRPAPEVEAKRKPLKRVSLEARRQKYPGVNGATAGCDCAECKKMRKGFEGGDPLDAQTGDMKAAAKDYAEKGRTFGVEIEFYAGVTPTARDLNITARPYIALKLGEQGLRASTEEHRERWSVKSDQSLGDRPSGCEGVEVTTPILRGEKGIEDLVKACAVLNEAGAKVNKTCGLHVHIGAKDLTLRQRVNLASQFIRYERFFDLILPESRRSNRYAMPVRSKASATGTTSTKAAEHAILKLLEVKTEAEMARVCSWEDHHARFSDARAKHGTFEFRQHSGTTNAEKITNWVRLILAFVEVAKDKPALPFYSRKLTDEEEMEKFFETFSIARDLRAYYRKRHAALFKDPNNDD